MNFDATKGGPAANAYADEEEADDLLEFQHLAEAWWEISDSDDESKERLLVTATRDIDRLRMRYGKEDASQALCFPVINGPSGSDGFDEAKRACAYQALWLATMGDELKDAAVNSIAGVTQERMSSVSRTMNGLNPIRKYSPEALHELRGFIDMTVHTTR